MSPRNILITGCNRGIGLELVKQFLKNPNPPEHLFATCRDLSTATDLNSLTKNNANLHILILDVTDHEAYSRIFSEIKNLVKEDGLNLIINNAGILVSEVDGLSAKRMREAFEINCIAPIFLTKTLLPLIKTASKNRANDVFEGTHNATIIMISTAMASISENSSAGSYAHRCSKVALNMAVKNLSIELNEDGILVLAIHPGWVQTEMGGAGALITTEKCCSTMLKTIAGISEKDHGTFIRYNHESIPW